MAQDTYNGWTNYETWNAYLWQKNVESTYKFFLEKAKHYSEMAGDDPRRGYRQPNGASAKIPPKT